MSRQFRSALPTFYTAEEERGCRMRCLAIAHRIFADFGFSENVAGPIAARDSEHLELFWVNPFGLHFGLIRVADIKVVDASGHLVEGDGSVKTAAFTIYAAIREARPNVGVAAHAHSTYGKAWSSLGRLPDLITHDACRFYVEQALFDGCTGADLELQSGKRLAHALGGHKSVFSRNHGFLRNHGLLSVGGSVAEAAWSFVTIERSCQAQRMGEAARTTVWLDHYLAEATQAELGNGKPGWFAFQSLYQAVVRAQPDQLD